MKYSYVPDVLPIGAAPDVPDQTLGHISPVSSTSNEGVSYVRRGGDRVHVVKGSFVGGRAEYKDGDHDDDFDYQLDTDMAVRFRHRISLGVMQRNCCESVEDYKIGDEVADTGDLSRHEKNMGGRERKFTGCVKLFVYYGK